MKMAFFRVLSFFAVSYPSEIGAIFVQKYEVSQKNRLTVSYVMNLEHEYSVS